MSAAGQGTCHRRASLQSPGPSAGSRRGRGGINSTARWPERLEQVATLLRADGAAVIALQGETFRTLFAAGIEPGISWSAVLGDEVLRRALVDRECFATALAAERWGPTVAYAILAPIEGAGERGALCALRHGIPFDAVEVAAAQAAATLLNMAFSDAQAVAEAERRSPLDGLVGGQRAALRVLVVEDHPAMRIGLSSVLQEGGLEVVAACATAGEAARRLGELRCDVVLVDLSLPDSTGVEAVARLRATDGATPIVVLSVDRSPDVVRAALRAGANAFVGKDAPASRIAAAVRAAAAGLAAVSSESAPALLRPIAERIAADTDEALEAPPARPNGGPRSEGAREPITAESLSPREMELLRYLAEGYTNKEIARAMVLAEDTVKKGVQALIAKLGATDRTHAVVLAIRAGLIE